MSPPAQYRPIVDAQMAMIEAFLASLANQQNSVTAEAAGS